MNIPTSLCNTAFDEAIDQLDAPTYVVRVSPGLYNYAARLFGQLWRLSVVADGSFAPTAWQIERHSHGKLINKVFNEGC